MDLLQIDYLIPPYIPNSSHLHSLPLPYLDFTTITIPHLPNHSNMTTHTPIHLPPSTCPFCAISTLHPPLSPHTTAPDSPQWTPANLPYQQNPSYLLLSTPDVIAFLDIMPLTKGHVLVVPRKHVVRMGELEVVEAGKVSSFDAVACLLRFSVLVR